MTVTKFSAFIFALLIMSQTLFADIDSFHIDGRVSAFFPSDKRFREIYGDCLANYEIEVGKTFCDNYDVWANFGWINKHGKTEHFHTKTKFDNFNFSIGGRYIFCFYPCLQPYIGLGINKAFIHVHNDSPYVKRKVYKDGIGGVVKLGLYYEPVDYLFFDLFADYLYQRIHFHRNVQTGGFKVGGGIGFNF